MDTTMLAASQGASIDTFTVTPIITASGPNPSGKCLCGCGQYTTVAPWTDRHNGWEKGKSKLYIRGHKNRTWNLAPYRIEDRGYETPCWIWQLGKQSSGYGEMYVDGKPMLAHRVYFERAKGEPIGDGMHIHHKCHVRDCVNAEHGAELTPKEHQALTVQETKQRKALEAEGESVNAEE